ncbi:MAG: hypothetical protein E7582_02690 [Ruminococcaceae bacterium]|nr:hypothetical protein [Oscillospiraceae bacterium]
MNIIKSNMSYVLKIFINHFVSAIYSLILFMVFSVALGGKLVILGSIISIAFYLFLIYSFMWEAGAKRAVGYNLRKIKIFDGTLIMLVGGLPFYLTTVFSCILWFFKTDSTFAELTVDVVYRVLFYVNVFFSQCMYSGLFTSIFGSIPDVLPFFYLFSLIPGILVGTLAYFFGSKSFRLRTIFGIKYNEEKEKIKNNY